MSERVEEYLTHLQYERRLSEHSVASYRRDLAIVARFAAGQSLRVESFGRGDLEALVRDLMGEGRSPRSVARLVATVRGYFRFLCLHGHVATNPAADLQAPRAWRVLPRFLAADDVERLLCAPDVSEPRGVRDRAMIEVLYATGLRVSELIGLRSEDLHLDDGYLAATGKGRKQRIVPIGDEAASWLRRYMTEARPQLLAAGTLRASSSMRVAAARVSRAWDAGRFSSGMASRWA